MPRRRTLKHRSHKAPKLISYPFNILRLCCVSVLFLATPAIAEQNSNVRVVDGDTIELNGQKHRFHGIDTPEAGQKCRLKNGGYWPCGKQAITFLENALKSGPVHCDNRGYDDFGRIISVCMIGKIDINAELVRLGLAWAFVRYSRDYVDQEKEAQSAKIGVWQAKTQTAWDYRTERWKVAEQIAPEGCPIKGNISKNGKIYHAPWSPWYNRTKVSLHKGERWFCNEDEALKAGWRAPYWGN